MKMSMLFLLIMLSFSCAASKKTKQLNKLTPINDSDYVTLRRTACYGTCPVYEVQIFANGKVVYTGERFVANVGIYNAQISTSTAQSLFLKISAYNWNSFPDKYPIDNYDFPQFHLHFSNASVSKTIQANTNADEKLIALSQEIDLLISKIVLSKTAE